MRVAKDCLDHAAGTRFPGLEHPVCGLGSGMVDVDLQRDTEEKARQPEIKLGAIAQAHHTAKLCNAKRSRTRNPKPTHGAQGRPKQSQPRAGRDRAWVPLSMVVGHWGRTWRGREPG
jgi:hypothetical protein